MNFILTRYIYPLESRQLLSRNLNIYLDNPRTEAEIDIIYRYIVYSNSPKHVSHYHNFILPLSEQNDGLVSVEGIIDDLVRKYSPKDPYVKSFYEQNKHEEFLKIIAKMWIIARFDDEGEFEKLKKEGQELLKTTGQPWLCILERDHPLLKSADVLVNYTYLLSVLIHTEDDEGGYSGHSFILHHDAETLRIPTIDKKLNFQLGVFGIFCAIEGHRVISEELWAWIYYPFIRGKLFENAKALDTVLDKETKEKLLYVAYLLRVAGNDIKDEKMRLVVLVSILELLLTHSPDFQRFNVEDSITKQFVLKASILIYQNDKSRDLDELKKRLKTIYTQRSNIAHGNFQKVEKYIQNLSKKDGEEEYFSDLIIDLYEFIKAVLQEYIKDRKFVEFLKEN